jgi:hypothetical protein
MWDKRLKAYFELCKEYNDQESMDCIETVLKTMGIHVEGIEWMKEQLLNLAHKTHKEEPFNAQREFDCLIYLIEDGTISTFEELAEYGYEKGESRWTLY